MPAPSLSTPLGHLLVGCEGPELSLRGHRAFSLEICRPHQNRTANKLYSYSEQQPPPGQKQSLLLSHFCQRCPSSSSTLGIFLIQLGIGALWLKDVNTRPHSSPTVRPQSKQNSCRSSSDGQWVPGCEALRYELQRPMGSLAIAGVHGGIFLDFENLAL